jgi:tetratricopeptide (TPR) repeat protein
VQNVAHAPQSNSIEPDLARDLAELEELGYTDPVAASRQPAAESAARRRDFHLARVLLAQGRAIEAIPLFERIVNEDREGTEIRLYLAHAYFQSARYPECRGICEALLAKSPDSPLAPLARAHLAIAEGKYREARAYLTSSQEGYGIIAALDAAIGMTYLQIENWDEAAAAFRAAIATDVGLAAAHEGLARALLATAQFGDAAEAALDAIRLRYDLAGAHRTLGKALQALGRDEAAAGAFATSEMLYSRMPSP